jgi:predicted nucleic-acid-binding Zn-ribbon protein
MALKDVFNSVFGSNNIRDLLDEFLRKREKEQPERTGWHPSSFCDMCPREHVIRRLIPQYNNEEELEPGLLRIFDTGHAHHYWYQNEYFGPMGILWGPWRCLKCGMVEWGFRQKEKCPHCGNKEFLYEEIPVVAKLPDCVDQVNGHADGLILIRNCWYLLEIKTINSNAFKWMKGAKEGHIKQAQIYCELINQGLVPTPFGVQLPSPEKILILYISKNDSELKDYIVDADPDFAREQLKRPILAEKAFATRSLPEKLPECTKLSDKRAQKCAVRHRCFERFGFEDLLLIGQNR